MITAAKTDCELAFRMMIYWMVDGLRLYCIVLLSKALHSCTHTDGNKATLQHAVLCSIEGHLSKTDKRSSGSNHLPCIHCFLKVKFKKVCSVEIMKCIQIPAWLTQSIHISPAKPPLSFLKVTGEPQSDCSQTACQAATPYLLCVHYAASVSGLQSAVKTHSLLHSHPFFEPWWIEPSLILLFSSLVPLIKSRDFCREEEGREVRKARRRCGSLWRVNVNFFRFLPVQLRSVPLE